MGGGLEEEDDIIRAVSQEDDLNSCVLIGLEWSSIINLKAREEIMAVKA